MRGKKRRGGSSGRWWTRWDCWRGCCSRECCRRGRRGKGWRSGSKYSFKQSFFLRSLFNLEVVGRRAWFSLSLLSLSVDLACFDSACRDSREREKREEGLRGGIGSQPRPSFRAPPSPLSAPPPHSAAQHHPRPLSSSPDTPPSTLLSLLPLRTLPHFYPPHRTSSPLAPLTQTGRDQAAI